jgi:hypothetical protein
MSAPTLRAANQRRSTARFRSISDKTFSCSAPTPPATSAQLSCSAFLPSPTASAQACSGLLRFAQVCFTLSGCVVTAEKKACRVRKSQAIANGTNGPHVPRRDFGQGEIFEQLEWRARLFGIVAAHGRPGVRGARLGRCRAAGGAEGPAHVRHPSADGSHKVHWLWTLSDDHDGAPDRPLNRRIGDERGSRLSRTCRANGLLGPVRGLTSWLCGVLPKGRGQKMGSGPQQDYAEWSSPLERHPVAGYI